MSIPKHILQIALGEHYLNKQPLELIKDNITILNPGYSYTLMTDNDCLQFLESNFPEHIELYKSLNRPQYKSDLIRYLYIYVYGGYYIDIDLLPKIEFNKLNIIMRYPSAFFTLGAHKHDNKYIECANGFFASVQHNSLFLDFVKEMYLDINPQDFSQNKKRMYSVIENKMIIEPYRSLSGVFLLEEYSNYQGKYFIRSSIDKDVCYSNGNGYPFKEE